MIRNLLKAQTHNDGIVKIYNVTNIAVPPDRPKEGLELKHILRYKERTVGLTRQNIAQQAGVTVAYVLRVPRLRDVSAQDVAIPNDGKQYRIRRVTYPEDISPPVMDLELSETEVVYDIT